MINLSFFDGEPYEVNFSYLCCLSNQVWDRIAPGLASQFDSPYTVPIIAPRPLLIVNGMIPLGSNT